MKLKGRVAVVSGAERGIGSAIAIRLAQEGAAVVVNYIASLEDATRVVARIEEAGGRAVACKADVADLASQERLLAVADSFGPLSILVNNAAVQVHEPVLASQEATWQKTHDVNLKASYFLSVLAAQKMQATGGGSIVCISSIHDVRPLRDRAIYAITKAAVTMLVKSLALELSPMGIRVNGIAPGAILTDMNRGVLRDPEQRERLLARIPMGRLGDPEDIAGPVAFLASSDAAYVNGSTLYVDGGLLLS